MELTEQQKDELFAKAQAVFAKLPDNHPRKNNPRGFGLSKDDYKSRMNPDVEQESEK